MPGHITGVFTHRESGTGGIVLMNNTARPRPTRSRSSWPTTSSSTTRSRTSRGSPGTEVPDELAGLLGRWFSEGQPFVFWVSRVSSGADRQGARRPRPVAVREKVADDVYRDPPAASAASSCASPARRRARSTKLNWATYLFTREPIAFGEHLATVRQTSTTRDGRGRVTDRLVEDGPTWVGYGEPRADHRPPQPWVGEHLVDGAVVAAGDQRAR